MQNDENTRRLIIFLIILNSAVLVLAFTLTNLAYAQEIEDLHQKTLEELSKRTSPGESPGEHASIAVGKEPQGIAVDDRGSDRSKEIRDRTYVANFGDNSISVISLINNSRVGEDISVGDRPTAITKDEDRNRVYVANYGSNTISVINQTSNAKTGEDIEVGEAPSDVGFFGGKIYVANLLDYSISTIDRYNYSMIKDIPVRSEPEAMDADAYEDTLYVANMMANTVSVININNDSLVGDDISVGEMPVDIEVGLNKVYVANQKDDTVSVIDIKNNSKVDSISVGDGPSSLGILGIRKLYVANSNDNTVSVIDIKNNSNSKVNSIPVGREPSAIGISDNTNTIYVSNEKDNTVSVIDGRADRVVAGVTFNVRPFNSGHIECDKLIAPTEEEFYVWSGEECTATPNDGFEFISWVENLGGNSTQIINQSKSTSALDSISDSLGIGSEKPEAKLTVTKFGTFTANFKELPPPIPPQYWATLFAVVASALVGSWLTPSFIGWRKAKKQRSRQHYYREKIKDLYKVGPDKYKEGLDKNDIGGLNELSDSIKDEYTRGKITKEQIDRLEEDISLNYLEIFNNEIDSVIHFSKRYKGEELLKVKNDIEDQYAKRRITDQHYGLLSKKIESALKTMDDKTSNNKLEGHIESHDINRSPI